MAEKKSMRETELIQSQPLWMMLDIVPSQEPDKKRSMDQNQLAYRLKVFTIKKLIAFMKDDDQQS